MGTSGTSKPQHTTLHTQGHSPPSEWPFFYPPSVPILFQNSPIIIQSLIFSHFQNSFHLNFHIFPFYPYFYSPFGIFNKWKISKNSEKHHISYLLKNHCFWHFSPFLSFSQIYQNHPISEKPKKHHFYYFPIRWRQYDFPHFYPIVKNGENGENAKIAKNWILAKMAK